MAYPTAQEYFTGRQLWMLAMPTTVRPRAVGVQGGDPGLAPGRVSAVTRAGAGAAGTVTVYSGGPTDTFAVRLECVAGGALGTATYRTRLQSTEAWSVTQTTPTDGLVELPESGMILLLSGTFTTAETHDFSTVESAQQVAIRQAISLEMDRLLRTRGGAPLDSDDYGVDLSLLGARMGAWELLRVRGYDPRSRHDEQVMIAAKRSRAQLVRVREEREQGGWGGQDSTAGVALSSQDAQGVELW